jgi:hypothetical protein
VAITERETFPCCTLKKSLLDTHHALKKPNGWAVTGVDLTVFAFDYEKLESISAEVVAKYDGLLKPLTEGRNNVKIYVDDEDDDAYPAPDGSDDWIYARTISLRVHHKIEG